MPALVARARLDRVAAARFERDATVVRAIDASAWALRACVPTVDRVDAGMSSKHKNPVAYFGASAMAAVINFPLWKASAMAQAGFEVPGSYAAAYLRALRPPYKGVVAVVGGMTWARGAIFYGSDAGRAYLESNGVARGSLAAVAAPPLVVSTLVQIVNQPIIRGSVMRGAASKNSRRRQRRVGGYSAEAGRGAVAAAT